MRHWLSIGDGKTYGPYDMVQLQSLAQQGRIPPGSNLCPEGGTAWVPASTVMGASAAVMAAPTAMPPTGVPAPTRYAGFWKRFVALFIDWVITTIAAVVVAFIAGFLMATSTNITENSAELLGNLVGIVVSWVYWASMESSALQATVGKMALGIRVTDLHGGRIGFGKASGRYFGKIVSGLLLGIGFIMAGFTERKQALHDQMAGCLVVNK